MNLISGAKITLLLRLKEHCCLPYSSLCRLHFSYKNCSVMQWAVWLASRLEPAREPITSRAEPLLWAREIAEPSKARLAARPSRSEPSRAWLGSARFQPYFPLCQELSAAQKELSRAELQPEQQQGQGQEANGASLARAS